MFAVEFFTHTFNINLHAFEILTMTFIFRRR